MWMVDIPAMGTVMPPRRAYIGRFEAAGASIVATKLRVPQVMQDGLPDEDAENLGKGGCGLGSNLDVAICRADWHLHKGEHQVCCVPLWTIWGPLP